MTIHSAKEAIAWIHSRLKFGARPGLLRVKELLRRLDHPEKGQNFIHIAGTNGKGSTTAFLAEMLKKSGLNVGTFTSPYIVKFNERIQINGNFISDEKLLFLVQKVKPLVDEMDQEETFSGITEFEINTVLGFLYFKDQVDVAIIEVGLGGLLDSTNVLTPRLSGITTIGLDHMKILGNTLAEIAYQKAGIIKENIPVVVGNVAKNPLEVIQKVANEKNSSLSLYKRDYQGIFLKDLPTGELFSYEDEQVSLPHLEISLIGRHQVENAAMAVRLFLEYCHITQWPFKESDIKYGLKHTFWPARMELLNQEPLIFLDGAHNDHAVKRLVDNMKMFKGREIFILYSALKRKDITEMLADLKKIPHSHLVVTTFDYPETLTKEDLASLKEQGYEIAEHWEEGLGKIIQQMDEEDILVITGSLYFSSLVRPFFKKE